MCSILLTNKHINNVEETNALLQRRGPDHTSIVNVDGWTMIHNLLAITGEFTPQPIVSEDVYLIFNGEIYNIQNCDTTYKSDGYFILDMYKEHGSSFFEHLDGEYAIILFDAKNKKILFGGDLFLTKPIFIARDGEHICISSYKSAISTLGFERVLRLEPNTYYELDITTYNIQKNINYNWDLNQNIDTYEIWERYFLESLQKRSSNIKGNFLVPVSCGHDSGGIICGLKLLNKNNFMTYSFTGNEDRSVISERVQNVKTAIQRESITQKENRDIYEFKRKHVEPFFYGPTPYAKTHEGFLDPGGTGLLALLKDCRENYDIKVQLSGQGGDEVMSNKQTYGFQTPNPNVWPDKLEKIFPYGNFYYGANWSYLNKEECIAGSVGVETRYPFLDKNVVQSFLNLTPALKNQHYKAPLEYMLKKYNFPFIPGKLGFDLKIV